MVPFMPLFFLYHWCNIVTFGCAFSARTTAQISRRRFSVSIGPIVHKASSSSSSSSGDDDGRTSVGAWIQGPSSSPSTSSSSSSTNREVDERRGGGRLTSAITSHHVAIKTRNIENAIDFYSLLGFRVETKFVAGPARAAWLIHGEDAVDSSSSSSSTRGGVDSRCRIELLEVPSHMLDEPDGMTRRAIDLTKRVELLGLNHLALDVTNCIPRSDDDDDAASAAVMSSADGSTCELYQLQEWMDDLNSLSIDRFGKALRIAMSPTKRIVGKEVYEMAFLYDADGALVELMNHSGTLMQDVADGWSPWDGRGFIP
jgi:catechol 2,3-dioxygenase-like lactoylglutathione lyase family enzyme